jgi:hypothetical protein
MTLLDDLASGEPMSPTAFSLSVHNAATGIFSILRGDTSSATAIAAGDETFGFGLLEAASQYWADPATPVLLVHADEPVPDEYRDFVEPGETAHAVALLLGPTADWTISCEIAATGSRGCPRPEGGLQSAAFMRCVTGAAPTSWGGPGRTWIWRHDS